MWTLPDDQSGMSARNRASKRGPFKLSNGILSADRRAVKQLAGAIWRARPEAGNASRRHRRDALLRADLVSALLAFADSIEIVAAASR